VSALFDEHAGMVLGLCRLLLRDHHEAEDAAQQTFVSAYRSLLRGTEPREPGPWLAAIARNECRGRLRRRMRAPLPLDGEMEVELADTSDLAELADRRAELAQLATEIAKLPSRQREALALRDFLGLSYEEVASTLSVSVPVVESLLFRARRRLRDTVRTVPRYAAGIVIVPIALRAAVARDVPDFDAITVGLGIAGVAGAAAGGVAKLLSVPASVKVAATVAVVATGSVVAPKLVAPSEEAAPPAAVVRVEDRDPGASPVFPAPSAEPRRGHEAAVNESASEQAAAPPEPAPPAAEPAAPAADPEPLAPPADPGRISTNVPGAALLPPPPPPLGDEPACPVLEEPATTTADESAETTVTEDGDAAATPTCPGEGTGDSAGEPDVGEEPGAPPAGEAPPETDTDTPAEPPPAPSSGSGWGSTSGDGDRDDAGSTEVPGAPPAADSPAPEPADGRPASA
jgi:RNA polymerase sigma-70 factor (ECF subfamily)